MNILYEATLKHFQAKEVEALAVLNIYLNNPSGVADHSNFLQEMIEWTQKLSDSRENIKTLKSLLNTGEANDE
tara:strand:- start:338 stop:556 length:219 start_codon:yes stop_codon:yes gene_type:complete